MIRTTLAAPLLLLLAALPSAAAEVRDPAGMFSPAAVRKADTTLERLEREQRVPVLIETVESLREAATPEEQKRWASENKNRVIELLAERRDRDWGNHGVYILLSKRDHVISNVLVKGSLAGRLDASRRKAVRDAFIGPFRDERFDEGLTAGVQALESALSSSQARGGGASPLPGPRGGVPRNNPPAPVPAPAPRKPASSLPAWLIPVGLLLLVFFGFRILRGLLGGGRAPMGPGGVPGGYGRGFPGGGYGPGGGGGGGGFWSGMFGGMAGSVLGNWGYDRFGRSHGQDATTGAGETYGTGGESYAPPDSGGALGGDDNAGQGSSWDTGGGSPGDWLGGGDAGGGGDWGGGGGGGGGSDW